MQYLTCMQIDGLCDAVIEGETGEEVYDNRERHLREAAELNQDHRQVLESMRLLSDIELTKFKERLDSLLRQ